MLKPNYVFVIDANKKALAPCRPSIARRLLNLNRAAVFKQYPFTIILKKEVSNVINSSTLKIDPGSKFTGFALVNSQDEVIWGMELEHRGLAISASLQKRSAIRRGRRTRHTRYRPARFLNRARSKGWLAPSLMHRILTIETWVKRLIKLFSVVEIRQELVRFDLQQLENPEISGVKYQQGELQGFEVREYLLNKWGRKCTYCSIESVPLQVEHVIPKAKGGSNRISNLCLACDKCNKSKGVLDIKEFLVSKPDLLKTIQAQLKRPLKDAAAVNATRWGLLNKLKLTGLLITTGSGGLTKFNRSQLGLKKAHWIDAACVGAVNTLKMLIDLPLQVKCTGHGNKQATRNNKYGFPCAAAKQAYTHCQTGDIVRVTIHQARKQFKPGAYTGRIKGPTPKSADVQIGKFRIQPAFKDIKFLHQQDGYRYNYS